MTPAPSRTILELRHIDCEPAAGYLPALEEFGEVHTVHCGRDELPTDPTAFAGIIAMGGPMGVGDVDTVAWLGPEIELLRLATELDVPVWGVCLGSQLLAAALGAKVSTGDMPEVGVLDVGFTAATIDDPVWSPIAAEFPQFAALQWHSDTFALPEGAQLLASSAAYPHQLFRFGRSYGLQFHLEADLRLATEWMQVDAYRHALESTLGPNAAAGFLADIARCEEHFRTLAGRAMQRWLATIA